MSHDPRNLAVIVCQGKPLCNFQGDEAVMEQDRGCSLCKRIYIDEFGNETVTDPAERPN